MANDSVNTDSRKEVGGIVERGARATCRGSQGKSWQCDHLPGGNCGLNVESWLACMTSKNSGYDQTIALQRLTKNRSDLSTRLGGEPIPCKARSERTRLTRTSGSCP